MAYRLGNRILKIDNKLFYAEGVSPVNPVWSGLTSYWRLDETSGTNAADSKGSVNLTKYDGIWTAGKNNNCFGLTGGTTNLSLISANNPFSNAQLVTGSVAMWVKLNPSTKINGGDLINIEGYLVIIVSKTTGYVNAITSGEGGDGKTYSVDICDNNWHLIVLTWVSNSLYIYVDTNRSSALSQQHSPRPDSLNRPMSIGSYWSNVVNHVPIGLIDEVAIWCNRVLSQAEVTTLYNSGNGLFY